VKVATGWLERPSTTGGLDHLGAQQPCIEIYSRLLPGITNVTDRARYYSLYPWFAWSFDRRNRSKDVNEAVDLFRRADCLFTLITERHARRGTEGPTAEGAAMVGREKLLPALDRLEAGQPLNLSDYATRDEEGLRYFQNRLGGLGQYYFGTLHDMGILSGESRPWIEYTKERGAVLAQAVDEAVPGDLFFKTLREDRVSLARLDHLASFSFWRIPESPQEHRYLLDLFFARTSEFERDGVQRRLSLALLLSLISASDKRGEGIVDAAFAKNALYAQSLGAAKSWNIPEPLRETAAYWRTYGLNDLLSTALQAIFFSSLHILFKSEARFANGNQLAAWLVERPETKKALRTIKGKSWGDAVARAQSALPDIADWDAEGHELSIQDALFDAYSSVKDLPTALNTIATGLQLLVAIEARRRSERADVGVSLIPTELLHYYPINLATFERHSTKDWQGTSLIDLTGWLVAEWGIATHLRVALRKLRSNPKATFRLRPTEAGLEVDPDIPPITPTNPRLRQSLQILRDLGLTELSEESTRTRLTQLGREILGGSIEG